MIFVEINSFFYSQNPLDTFLKFSIQMQNVPIKILLNLVKKLKVKTINVKPIGYSAVSWKSFYILNDLTRKSNEGLAWIDKLESC